MLAADDRIVPIYVSEDQAQSVRLALEGEQFKRPLTHDLLVEMVTEYGAAIDRVRIDGLHDQTFYAKIDTEQYRDGERRQLTFDARPSDGIAIALRMDCPIELADDVLEEAGRQEEAF
jgi:hypothetical protein